MSNVTEAPARTAELRVSAPAARRGNATTGELWFAGTSLTVRAEGARVALYEWKRGDLTDVEMTPFLADWLGRALLLMSESDREEFASALVRAAARAVQEDGEQ